MLTMQTMIDPKREKELFATCNIILEECFTDFPEIKNNYLHAMDVLEKSLGNSTVEREKDAICQQTVSRMLFSLVQGIQANCEGFLDPVRNSFLDVDPEVYLKENESWMLPDYLSAQEARKQFFSVLNDTQSLIYRDVTEYVCYLETVVPKLAHYYGYLLGNAVLHRFIPGYRPDIPTTVRYDTALKNCFGEDIDWDLFQKMAFQKRIW